MRLTVLSRSASVPSTSRLVAAARARGHKVSVLNPVKVELSFDREGQDLFYERKRVAVPDVLLPRLAGSIAAYGLAVVDQFAMRGAIVMNDARAIARSRNPMRYLQVLAANGLEIPPTRMVHEASDLSRLSKAVGGYPLLMKILRGTEKHGTMVCESQKSLQAALEAVLGLGHDLVLQQYLKGGRTLRVLVVGGKATLALERQSSAKSNGKRKAKLASTLLSPAVARLAERAAKALALEVCSIDVLESRGAVHVMEINATPALPEIEKASGLDVAQMLIGRAEELSATNPLKTANPEGLAPPPAGRRTETRLKAASDKE